ncbi:hypothetical protein [Trueperella bialowiezensis]|uniref:Uncharacterized protein n=1 Tax=Trueperella bialowiezensis TaxID=312285 RepID=A0A448PCX1_9ACTO|nr:hypothetical protein [Trueperella bialowiezensis]VEI12789.1 Uncharacterised protein [Trueperella bialowiezensis]
MRARSVAAGSLLLLGAAWLIDADALRALLSSLAVTFPVALACSIIALPITVYGRGFHRPAGTYMAGAAVAFVLIPIPAITHVLSIFLVPFSRPILVATLLLASFPVAFLVQYATFHVSATAIMLASHSTRASLCSLWRIYPGQLSRSLLGPAVVASLVMAFDPGLALAAGTSQPVFGRVILDSISYYAAPSAPGTIIVLCAIASAWLVLALAPRASSSANTDNDSSHWRFVPPRWLTILARLICTVATCVYGAIVVNLAFHVAGSHLGDAVSTLGTSLILITVSLGVASGCAAWSWWLNVSARWPLRAAHLWLAGLGLTGGGLIIAALSRGLIHMGATPLAGGAGFAGGALGIVCAQFLLAYPVFFLIMAALRERHRTTIGIAYDAGASPLRVFATVFLPATRKYWVAAWAGLASFFMTHAAPTIFVDSPAWPQLGHVIALAAGSGDHAALATFSLVGFGASVLIALAFAGFIFRRSHANRA